MDYRARLKKLQRLMRGKQLDTILLSDKNDVRYYTGSAEGYAVVDRTGVLLLLSPLNNDTADLRVPHEFLTKKGGLKKHLTGSVGYDEENLTVSQFTPLKGLRLVPAAALIKKPREVKEEAEIRLIEKGCELNKNIVHELELEGKSEQQVARDIRLLQIENQAEQAFESIVAAGKHTAYIHYAPGTRVVKKGDMVVVDLGAKVNGYCSDTTRTINLGAGERQKNLIVFVEQVQQQLISQVRPGVTFTWLQELYEKILKKHGYSAAHLFGHGIGLDVHEKITGPLQKGMVLTVEPGVYSAWGGCRIEDVVLVGKKPRIL